MVDLIREPRWQASGQAGCCGIGTIARLNAYIVTTAARDSAHEAWLSSGEPYPLMSDSPRWEKKALKVLFASMRCRPQGTRYTKMQHNATWQGGAVTPEHAFIGVLESLSKYSIYFLSDNMSNTGDVHRGPFTTRAFVKWAADKGLGQFQTTGQVTSLRTTQQIQGWMFTPNWDVITPLIVKGRQEFIDYIKGVNNDKRIKARETDRRAERAVNTAALQHSLAQGWGERTSPRTSVRVTQG